jgi:hypothetical protein
MMDQLHTLLYLLLVHFGWETGVDQRGGLDVGGGCIDFCLHRILTWYPGQSLVPIQTELFWCKVSCMFRVLTFSDVLIFPEDLE